MLKSHNKSIFEILGRNPIHPFPARMAPGIALEALASRRSPLRVLDPMVGSGTVLAVARANGHRAYGVDLDPLAVLLTSVWTRTIDASSVNESAVKTLDRARRRFITVKHRDAYPTASDKETRRFIRFWFDEYARRQLASLANSIADVQDTAIRDALWCGFSRLIITKSAGASLAMDLSHSRPHKKFERAPVKPFGRFIKAVETVVANCPQQGSELLGPATLVNQGDARSLEYEDGSMDMVLTSPPYLNAIDYLRCSKFSLVWMGHNIPQLRAIRGESIGAEVSHAQARESKWVQSLIAHLRLATMLSRRDHAILSRYIWDMGQALAEVSRVLRNGGRAVYVVGDSTVRGSFIQNSSVVEFVAQEHGLKLVSKDSRTLPANRRYMPPPKDGEISASMDGRMRSEVVLVFDKPELSCC